MIATVDTLIAIGSFSYAGIDMIGVCIIVLFLLFVVEIILGIFDLFE